MVYVYNCKEFIDDRDTIIIHLLWADDLILLAESEEELQILFNNVFEFC